MTNDHDFPDRDLMLRVVKKYINVGDSIPDVPLRLLFIVYYASFDEMATLLSTDPHIYAAVKCAARRLLSLSA